MPIPQQKFREIVFQIIYSDDFADASEEDMISFMMHQLSVTKKVMRDAIERKRKIEAVKDELDRRITSASQSYDFERITRIERNILRLALFEIFYDETIPPKVAMSEAIRLGRKFATPEGAAFVNAILDSVYKKGLDESLQPVSAG